MRAARSRSMEPTSLGRLNERPPGEDGGEASASRRAWARQSATLPRESSLPIAEGRRLQTARGWDQRTGARARACA
eukprot:15438582-Alexandrium_andersonii.AAC.1